jgi:hypothetical protein
MMESGATKKPLSELAESIKKTRESLPGRSTQHIVNVLSNPHDE